jgi:hypothetical protein
VRIVASVSIRPAPTSEVASTMPELRSPKSAADELSKLAKDALYVSVGLGVILMQRAQVRRQELTKVFEERVKQARDLVGRGAA